MTLYLDPVEHSLASKGLRFANYIVDYIIAAIIQYAVLLVPIFMMEVGDVQSPAYGIFSLLFSLLVYVLYFALTEYLFKGRTIGKFITGTKAVTIEGNDINFTTALIRSLCRLIPFEAFSFLGETGWHDSISKTRVVSVNEFEQNRLKFNAIDQIGVNS